MDVKRMYKNARWRTNRAQKHMHHSWLSTHRIAVILVIPVLLFFIIWNVIPTLWMLGLSFYKYTLTNPAAPRFVGIANFLSIINDTSVWGSFGRTLLFVVLGVGIETFLGCLLAFLFWGSTSLPGRKLALTFLFAPMVITPVAAGAFFKLIYDPTFGILNYFITALGGKSIDFLGDARYAYGAVLLVDIWMWTPFMTLMGLAALGSVPQAELESARVDRLSFRQVLKHIIWPHGKFVLLLGMILRTIESFKTMDLPYQMTSGGPGNKTELIAIKLYRTAFNSFDMGKSSSLAFVTLLIAIAFTSIFLYILNSKNREVPR